MEICKVIFIVIRIWFLIFTMPLSFEAFILNSGPPYYLARKYYINWCSITAMRQKCVRNHDSRCVIQKGFWTNILQIETNEDVTLSPLMTLQTSTVPKILSFYYFQMIFFFQWKLTCCTFQKSKRGTKRGTTGRAILLQTFENIMNLFGLNGWEFVP